MKIRSFVFWLAALVAVLVVLAIWLGRKKSGETPLTASLATNAAPPVTTGSAANPPVRTNTSASTGPAASGSTSPSETKEQEMKEGLAAMNDVPIVFYGRLEDQSGGPVAGAQITANVRVYNDVRSTTESLTTVSDGNGMFQIKGGKGESLGIMPRKEGYVLATTGTEFKYSYMYLNRFTPDPNNPTVIKMWKLQGTESLVGFDKTYKLHYTGAPINFDLATGEIVPTGGDLRITVNRSPGIVSEHNPQDWSVQVEAVEGGLIQTTVGESRVTYAAPEDGYQPGAMFVMSTAGQSWHAVVDQTFFINSRGGKVYSKVRLILGINDTPDGFMAITLSGVANTNGSRNWEATALR